MAAVQYVAGPGHTSSIAFTTSTWAPQFTLLTPPGGSREMLDTTHLGTAGMTPETGGATAVAVGQAAAKTSTPSTLWTVTPSEVRFFYNPSQAQDIPIFKVPETITITFPKQAGTMVTAATVAGTGYLTDFQPEGLVSEDLMTATATIQWSGVPTYVEAATV